MARQVLPIAGAIVGAYFGNPQLGYAIGAVIGNAVDPQVIEGPALGEGQVNTAREGGYRPIVLGVGCVGCNIINVGPEIIRTHRDRQSKGGGPVSETKRRYRTFALRICEGPIAGLLRIWQGEKLVYDVRPQSVIPEESSEYSQGFTFYVGDETQLPDPDLEAYMGAGNVSAYRGTAYIVFKHFDLTDFQGAIPNFRFEVYTLAKGPGLTQSVILGTLDPPTITAASQSLNASEWNGPFEDVPGFGYGTSTRTRHLAWSGGAQGVQYSDDNGLTWLPSSITSIGSAGGQRQVSVIGETILIPGGIFNGYYRTTDGGDTHQHISGYSFNNIAIRHGSAIAFGVFGAGFVSVNDGLSFSESVVPDVVRSHGCYIAAGRQSFLLGATDPTAAFPRIGKSLTGTGWSYFDLTSSDDITVLHLCEGELGHWVAITDNGEIWFSVDDGETFVRANDDLGVPPFGLTYNGEVFIAAGGTSFGDGTVKYSQNKDDWTTASQPLIGIYLLLTLQGTSGNEESGAITLSSIVDFVHKRCGHTTSQYDTSEIDGIMVDGLVLADSYSGSDALRTILPIYNADASEHDAGSGYKINYILRGKPVVRTITIDDLVEEPDEAVRQDSLERPAKLHLHFQNPTIGYAAAKATSARSSPDVLVTGEVSVQVPITFGDVNEAWRISNKLHKIAWVEVAGTQELMLSDKDLDLVPTDCIGLSLRGSVIRYRMTSQEYVDGTIKCEFLADRQSAYTSNVTGIPLPDPEPPPPSIVGPTISVFGDWPALVDSHDALVAYVAATGQTSAWWGAVYQRSLDAGANYTTAATFDDLNTIMGVLQDDLPDASPHYTDTTNVVHVRLYTEETIDSLTQQQFLSEGGAFALSWEDSGATHWEFLQYRDAEQDSNGDWLLSTLLRGRLNTETVEHLAGATFVLLDNSLKVMPMQSAWLGMDLTHRAVSNGETPEDAVPYTDEFTGASQTEWPVANLLLERDGDDIKAIAIPRHRFGTDDAPVQSINHDGYRWTATDGSNTVNVDTLTPEAIFDVTGWASPVTVTVAQLNRYTGAGPTVSEDIA